MNKYELKVAFYAILTKHSYKISDYCLEELVAEAWDASHRTDESDTGPLFDSWGYPINDSWGL